METENESLELIRRYQDAWTAGDFEAAARYIAEDIEFVSPQQRIVGAEAFLRMLNAFQQRIGTGWEYIASTVDGENVLILYKLFMPTGAPAVCTDYFELEEGHIRREVLVFDPKPFLPQ
jgi:ketosteroid isomerase-like protein